MGSADRADSRQGIRASPRDIHSRGVRGTRPGSPGRTPILHHSHPTGSSYDSSSPSLTPKPTTRSHAHITLAKILNALLTNMSKCWEYKRVAAGASSFLSVRPPRGLLPQNRALIVFPFNFPGKPSPRRQPHTRFPVAVPALCRPRKSARFRECVQRLNPSQSQELERDAHCR